MILFKTIHNDYVSSWADYRRTSSFIKGARWNHAGIPVMYTSSNVQNAMLEIANYWPSPKIVNKLYRLCIFEFPELQLKIIEPKELPSDWASSVHSDSTKDVGSKHLKDPDNQGIILPSTTINHYVATHPINSVRNSVYANVVVDLESIEIGRIKLVDACYPVFSDKMFG